MDEPGQEYQLFYLTKETLWKLKKLCMEERVTLEADILLEASDWTAHRDLKFMEKHLFRFHRFRPWSEDRNISGFTVSVIRQMKFVLRRGNPA